jgi:hypothetical protein
MRWCTVHRRIKSSLLLEVVHFTIYSALRYNIMLLITILSGYLALCTRYHAKDHPAPNKENNPVHPIQITHPFAVYPLPAPRFCITSVKLFEPLAFLPSFEIGELDREISNERTFAAEACCAPARRARNTASPPILIFAM